MGSGPSPTSTKSETTVNLTRTSQIEADQSKIQNLKSKMAEAATEIVRRLRAEGFQAYLVGGCVRDLVMGHEPADYDVATDATPEQVLGLYPGSLTVGAHFGVVAVPPFSLEATDSGPQAGGSIEVATFRSDGRYADGRHPSEVLYAKTPQGPAAA